MGEKFRYIHRFLVRQGATLAQRHVVLEVVVVALPCLATIAGSIAQIIHGHASGARNSEYRNILA